MSYGLCGAHRTGKTTLARAYAEQTGIELVETSTAAVFNRLGISPKAELPLLERIGLQSLILSEGEKAWQAGGNMFITDRTPLDMLAYTMAEAGRSMSLAESNALVGYMGRCFEMLNRYFSLIVLIQPGIPLIDDAEKAPAIPAYMEHLNALIRGLMRDQLSRVASVSMSRRVLTLSDRIDVLNQVVARETERQIISTAEMTAH